MRAMSRSAAVKKPLSRAKAAVPVRTESSTNASAGTLRMTDRKREAIIEAAVEEFRLNGFEATSMDRVASAAAVSKRTVYNHFPSKEVLFEAILTRLYHRIHEGLGVPYSKDLPLRDQLEELLWQKMQLLNDSNFIDLARVAISEAINSPERARAMVARMNEREEGLKIWIRAAVADRRLKIRDPIFAADQLQGLIKGFAFWPQISLAQPPLTAAMQKQVIESAVKMFLLSYSAT